MDELILLYCYKILRKLLKTPKTPVWNIPQVNSCETHANDYILFLLCFERCPNVSRIKVEVTKHREPVKASFF